MGSNSQHSGIGPGYDLAPSGNSSVPVATFKSHDAICRL